MIQLNDKRYIKKKTPYNIPNQYILNGTLDRINKKHYDVKIVDLDNKYLIIATPKIERI